MVAQQVERAGGEASIGQALLFHHPVHVETDQFRHVFTVLAQAGYAKRHDIQAIVQVFAKASRGNRAFEILITGGNDAHVERHWLIAADTQKAFFFEYVQQARLRGQIEIGDLVEEQGAAGGLLEHAGRGFAAGFAAEQLHAQVRRRHGGQAQFHERPRAARALAVQVTRRDFLAAARLTGDQHPGVVRGDAANGFAQLFHGLALAGRHRHHLRVPLETQIFLAQACALQRALDGDQQLGGGQRLFDEVVSAEADRLDRGLDRAVAGHHDHRHQQVVIARPFLEQADAVGVRHPDVEQHQVRTARVVGGARRLRIQRGADVVVLVGENLLNDPANVGLVVHHQNGAVAHVCCSATAWAGASITGRRRVRLAPPSLRFSAHNMPLCSSVIFFTIASPSPVPLSLVVT